MRVARMLIGLKINSDLMNLPGESYLNPQALAGEARVEGGASAPLEWSGEAVCALETFTLWRGASHRDANGGCQWGKCINIEL